MVILTPDLERFIFIPGTIFILFLKRIFHPPSYPIKIAYHNRSSLTNLYPYLKVSRRLLNDFFWSSSYSSAVISSSGNTTFFTFMGDNNTISYGSQHNIFLFNIGPNLKVNFIATRK